MGDAAQVRLNKWVKAAVVIGLAAALVISDIVIVPVLTGTLLALALAPVVTHVTRAGIPRALAAGLALIAVVGLIVGTIVAVRQPLASLAEQAPRLVHVAQSELRDLETALAYSPRARRAQIAAQPESTFVETIGPVAADFSRSVLGFGVSIVLSFFILTQGPGVGRAVLVALQGKRDRRRWLRVCTSIRRQTAYYLQLVTLINVAFGLCTALLLLAVGQSNAAAYGVIAGLLNFIPFIGAIASTGLIAAGAVADHGVSAAALIPPAAFLVLHISESQFITPHVMGRRLLLNPLIVVLGILVGTAAWGLGGAFLAVPTLTALKIAADAHPGWRSWGQVLGRGALADALQLGLHARSQPLEGSPGRGPVAPASLHKSS